MGEKVGDQVEKGEFIVELETDKVNAEIISEEAGVLTQILAAEGDTVLVGQVIAVVEAGKAQRQHQRLRKQHRHKQHQHRKSQRLLQLQRQLLKQLQMSV